MPMIQLKKLDSVELGWGLEISIFKSHSRLVSIVNGSPLQKNGKTGGEEHCIGLRMELFIFRKPSKRK